MAILKPKKSWFELTADERHAVGEALLVAAKAYEEYADAVGMADTLRLPDIELRAEVEITNELAREFNHKAAVIRSLAPSFYGENVVVREHEKNTAI